jgi:chromosomal replication initiator protein
VGRLVPSYVFETFVVGSANQIAAEAAREVAMRDGKRYNPFFLWGGVGLGKTHLVNAIGHAVLERPRRGRVACLAAETFMNLMIAALRQDQMAAFRDRFRELDVLILDDVQFLAGKERTQEEFFHTFEAVYTSGRQIVLTSDKPPQAIPDLEHRLRSRFEGGLIADVRPPTFEMRVEIALRKARLQGCELSTEIAAAVARCSGSSVRELEGGLVRVLASAALEGTKITPEMVESVLLPVTPARPAASIDEIQACVADHFGVGVDDLRSHQRSRGLGLARQMAMYLCRVLGEASLAAIAERFGGRDHTTVLYAVRTLEDRKSREPSVQALVDELSMKLRSKRS